MILCCMVIAHNFNYYKIVGFSSAGLSKQGQLFQSSQQPKLKEVGGNDKTI